MYQILELVRQFRKDEEGAALIEYTALIGILVAAVLATILAVSVWVNREWSALQVQLT